MEHDTSQTIPENNAPRVPGEKRGVQRQQQPTQGKRLRERESYHHSAYNVKKVVEEYQEGRPWLKLRVRREELLMVHFIADGGRYLYRQDSFLGSCWYRCRRTFEMFFSTVHMSGKTQVLTLT